MTIRRSATTAAAGLAAAVLAPTAGAGTSTDDASSDPSPDLLPGQVTTVAGTGAVGSSSDGTPALEATFDDDLNIAVAPDGTLYVAGRTREQPQFVGADGLVESVPEFSGGVSEDNTRYTHLWAVATGDDGTVYAATSDGIGVRRPDGQTETLAAGELEAMDIALGPDGTVYAADQANGLVRAVDPSGAVTTLAGEDGSIVDPRSIAVDSSGVVYVADFADSYGDEPSVVRRIEPDGTLSTVVGDGEPGFAGDGGPGFAGDGGPGFAGDGGPAIDAQVSDHLDGLAVGPDDTLYIADTGNQVVRVVALTPAGAAADDDTAGAGVDADASGDDPWADQDAGEVVTVAGPDEGLPAPGRIAVGGAGEFYVVERDGDTRLFRVEPGGPAEAVENADGQPLTGVRAVEPGRDGVLHLYTYLGVETWYPDGSMAHVAGGVGGGQEFADGVPATTVSTSNWDLALGPAGLYFADVNARTVYVVAPDGSMGSHGTNVDAGDGGVDVVDDGTVYMTEYRNARLTEVSPDGTSTVVAGSGASSWSDDGIGDGGEDGTTIASMDLDAHGNLYFTEPDSGLVQVLVRPRDIPGPFPWVPVGGGAAVVVIVAAAVSRRRRHATTNTQASDR